MEKGNILYIGGFKLPDKNAAAQRVVANAQIFKKLGYKVTFLGVTDDCEKVSIDDFEILNVKYPNTFKQWIIYLFDINSIINIVRTHTNIKIIIAYNYPSFALYRLLKFCKKRNIKLISDCTEWALIENNFSIKSIIKNLDTYLRMVLIHPKLDGLIAISTFLFKYYNPIMKNVINIPPLINKLNQKWAVEKYDPINDKDITLVYAGETNNRKDRIDKVIQVLTSLNDKKITNFKLIIIGLNEMQFKELYNIEKSFKIIDRITFLGRVPHLEVLQIVKKADFTIFVRDKNKITDAGFPTKFVESISCGTPVLTNKNDNLKEYLTPFETGFEINSNSEHELEESLKSILKMNKKEVLKMKDFCLKNSIFDTNNYIKSFKTLVTND
jgi:glycosyltransferase involved in cell wall biosynthesis